MTNEDAIDYIMCALGGGCHQVCGSKYRGDCTDEQIVEAANMAIKALEQLETENESEKETPIQDERDAFHEIMGWIYDHSVNDDWKDIDNYIEIIHKHILDKYEEGEQ